MTQEKKKFDMSRFKGTNMDELKKKDEDVNRTAGLGGNRVRAGYHELEKGPNYFRIYPHHNAVREMIGEIESTDLGNTFSENRVVYYVPQFVDDKDDKGNVKKDRQGKPLLKKINKAVFDSRIHGDTPRDIVDEYTKFVRAYAEQHFRKDQVADKESFLEPIEGNFRKSIPGLKAKGTWIVYADRITPKSRPGERTTYERKFAKLEFGKAVRIGVDKLAAQEASNQPLGTDPFTHPADGIAIGIDYNPDASTPNDYYTVYLYQPRLTAAQIQLFPLDEDQLSQLLEFPSLYKEYRNVYRRKDFEIALSGLQIFDQENSYNLINESEFVAMIEEISGYYPLDRNEETATDEPATETNGEAEADSTDEFTIMNRDELKAWHKTNKTGVLILPKHSDDDLRDAAREFVKENGGYVVEDQQKAAPEKAVEKVVEQPKKTEEKTMTAAERVQALKDKKKKEGK